MTARSSPGGGPRLGEIEIDTSVAHAARVQNYLDGGDGNFNADRKAADSLADLVPGGVDTTRATVRAMREFMAAAVQYLAGDLGIRQFLKLGTPVPSRNELHAVAQKAAPDARVVYVGHDPVVLAHAHTLRRSTPEGATAYVHGSMRDPEAIVRQASATLDFDRPVALMLLATLNFVPDEREPYKVVARLLRDMAPGSCLAVAHTANDIHEGWTEAAARLSEVLREPYVVRDHAEIARFFDGLEMVEPGLVRIDRWCPDGTSPGPQPDLPIPLPIYAGIGRKPPSRDPVVAHRARTR